MQCARRTCPSISPPSGREHGQRGVLLPTPHERGADAPAAGRPCKDRGSTEKLAKPNGYGGAHDWPHPRRPPSLMMGRSLRQAPCDERPVAFRKGDGGLAQQPCASGPRPEARSRGCKPARSCAAMDGFDGLPERFAFRILAGSQARLQHRIGQGNAGELPGQRRFNDR